MNDKIKVGDLEFVKYIDGSEIDAAVERVAAKVNEEYGSLLNFITQKIGVSQEKIETLRQYYLE